MKKTDFNKIKKTCKDLLSLLEGEVPVAIFYSDKSATYEITHIEIDEDSIDIMMSFEDVVLNISMDDDFEEMAKTLMSFNVNKLTPMKNPAANLLA